MSERASTPRAPAPPAEGTAGSPSAGRGNGRHAIDQPPPWPAAPGGLRRKILLRIRLDGPSSPDDLATRLGASRTGVLQQLRALEAAQLVTRSSERHGVGRPRHRYDVTPAAQDLLPSAYDSLAAGLLAAIDALDDESLLERILAARRAQTADRIRERLAERLPATAPLEARVRELAVIQDEQGYLAEVTVGDDGAFRLRERNCAIHRVAETQPAVCRAELALFRDVLGVAVERESHIIAGDRCCDYRIGGRADA